MNLIIGNNLYLNLIISIAPSLVFTWFLTQSFKVFLKCFLGEKFNITMFFADGDFPSAHTALVTTGLLLVVFFNYYMSDITDIATIAAYNNAKDFLIMATLTSIVIRDAMGQRHRQDNTNKNLKELKDYIKSLHARNNILNRIDATFQSIDNEAIKRVGHLKHEVVGGLAMGCICSLYSVIFFFNKYEWLLFTIIATVAYFFGMIIFLKLKR